MKKSNFNCFVPIDDISFIKGGQTSDATRYKNMIIQGVASTNDIDADQEILEPNGFNLEIFKKAGLINYEHQAKNSSKNIIGEPIEAYIKDNKLVLKAKLYEKVKQAQDVYDTIIAMQESGSTRKPGFSIEGQPISRDPCNPKRITKALITHCAFTWMPKNSNTFAEIVKGNQSQDFINPEYDIPANVDYIFKGTFGENEYTVHKDFTITKAISAGTETGQGLVGKDTSGAALKAESLDDDLKVLTIPISTIKFAADNWKDFQKDTKKAIQKAFHEQLIKGGEGSRGGKIIGHTKSGKPIYANQNALHEKKYNSQDHKEAAYAHLEHNKKTEGRNNEHHVNEFDRHINSSAYKKTNEEMTKETSKQYKEIKNEFGVRDALGGAVSGNYKKDLERVQKHSGKTFSKELYQEALQNTEQP